MTEESRLDLQQIDPAVRAPGPFFNACTLTFIALVCLSPIRLLHDAVVLRVGFGINLIDCILLLCVILGILDLIWQPQCPGWHHPCIKAALWVLFWAIICAAYGKALGNPTGLIRHQMRPYLMYLPLFFVARLPSPYFRSKAIAPTVCILALASCIGGITGTLTGGMAAVRTETMALARGWEALRGHTQVVAFVMAITLSALANRRRDAVLFGVAAALALVGVVVTFTRGLMLSALLGALLLLAMTRGRQRRRLAGVLLVVVLIGQLSLFIAFRLTPAVAVARFRTLRSATGRFVLGPTVAQRLLTFQYAYEQGTEHFWGLGGTGLGKQVSYWIPGRGRGEALDPGYAAWFFRMGWIGLILLGLWLYFIIRTAYRAWRNAEAMEKPYLLGPLVVVSLYPFMLLFARPLSVVYTAPISMYLLSIICTADFDQQISRARGPTGESGAGTDTEPQPSVRDSSSHDMETGRRP